MKQVVVGFLVVLAAGGVCLAQTSAHAFPFTLSKETTAIVEPLKADGTVDYVAAINELYGKGVTAENNGYVIWLRAVGTDSLPMTVRGQTLALLGVAPGYLPEKGFDDNGPDDFPEKPWKAGDNAGVATYLAANGKFLDLAVASSQKPAWWDTASSVDGTVIQVMLPSLNWLRTVSGALCGRALLQAGAGNFDGFLSDVMAVKRLSRLTTGWTFVSRLVSSGLDRLANDTIAAVVANGSLTSAQCAQLAKALDGIAPLPEMTEVFDIGERWEQLDIAATLAMGKLKRGTLGSQELQERLSNIRPDDLDWNIVLRRMNQQVDAVVAVMKRPKLLDERELEQALDKSFADIAGRHNSKSLGKGAGESREAYSNRMADALIVGISPSMSRAAVTVRAARMRDEMVRALVAAAWFRAESSHWPGTLNELVPKYLSAVPRDVYSADAADVVRYIQGESGIFIYSVGVNRIDDGGLSNPELKRDDIGEGITPRVGETGL